jgi:hypothetical protein
MNNEKSDWGEFLMTHGWAILIIIVVIGSLFAIGVFQIESSQQTFERNYICKYVCEQRGYNYKDRVGLDCNCVLKEGCVEILNNVTGNTDLYCENEKIITVRKVCC